MGNSQQHPTKRLISLLASPALLIPSVAPLLLGIALTKTKAELFSQIENPEWQQYADLFKDTRCFGLVDYTVQFYTTVLSYIFWTIQFGLLLFAVNGNESVTKKSAPATTLSNYWFSWEGFCVLTGVAAFVLGAWLFLSGALGKLPFVMTYIDAGLQFGDTRFPPLNLILYARGTLILHSLLMLFVASRVRGRV